MAAENIFIGRIAYNNGTKVDSALNTSNISLAVNNSVNFNTLNWCASCGVCNEYTIITDSYFMGKTTLENAQAMCFCTNSTDLNVLLSSINKIAATKSEGPFANLESAMTWIENNGLFITNQNYPPIATDGNVLHLDGGLPASYPLVGTSWYDLTENSNNSVLINGVTYNSSSKGYLEFNGSNQYVSVTGTTSIPIGNSNYTIGVWFNADTLGSKGLVGWGNYGTSNEANAFRLTSNGLVNYWWLNDLTVTTTITPGNWYYAVATFDGTTRSIYVNGSLIGSDTPTGHNVTTSGNLTVGVTNSTEYFDGDIGDVQIFDRAITSTEILQNYNSFVKRYNGTNTEICLTPFYCSVTPTSTPASTPTPTPTLSMTPTQTGTPLVTPTPTQTPISSNCSSSTYDVVLLLDQSGSISTPEYTLMSAATVDLVSKLSSYLSSGATGFQFGVVAFASSTSTLQVLTDDQNLINTAIGTRLYSSTTRIDLGLQQSYLTSIGTNTRNANKKIVLYTDGNVNSGFEAATVFTADTINSSVYNSIYKTEILCVGIGAGVNYSNLYDYAADPSLVFSATTFADIQAINAQIVNAICQPLLTPTPTPTNTQTPTATPISISMGLASEYNTEEEACAGTTTIQTVTYFGNLGIGTVLTNFSGTSGNNGFFKITSNSVEPQYIEQILGVNDDNQVVSISNICNLTPTPTPTNTPTGTPTQTPTPSVTLLPTIYTHGAVLANCSDYCTINYNIATLTTASANYASLNTTNGYIYGQGGVAGFVAYSDVSTDTSTGPFKIAEIDTTGKVISILVCVSGSCVIL